MTYSHILLERDGRLGRIVLNRPQILNGIDATMLAQCRAALAALQEGGGTDVVVLTGAGRAFCAGADLNFLEQALARSSGDADRRYREMNEILLEGHALIRELRAFPGLVVSLVNGPVVGGGVGLALAADMVLAASSAYFSLPFVPRLGLVPDLGGIAFMQNRIGVARAMGCALLGDRLDAETAAAWGLVWRCVPDGDLAAAGRALTERLLALPVSAVMELKRLSAQALETPLDAYLDAERGAQSRLFTTPEATEGVMAFLAKRQPDFRARLG